MESFDYEQVKIKLEALGVVFNDFMTKLNAIDTTLNDNVNVGENGAFQGVVAKSLLESWNHCSDRFGTFKDEFDVLLNSVMQVSSNNASLEDEVMAMYGGGSDSSSTTTSSTSTTSGGGGSSYTPSIGGAGTRATVSYQKM